MTEFTSEFIEHERERIGSFRVLTHAEKVAQAALDEIELLQAHEKECHKLIDNVLDNCNVGMCTGNSSLVFRLAELVSYYSSLQAENEKLKVKLEASESATVLFEVSEMLKQAQARVQELEQELKNKCANCGLASHDIWGDEDNVYDNLSTEEE